MDSKELRGLMEAYSEVYAPQEVDEASRRDEFTRAAIARNSGRKGGITFEPGPNWDPSANRGKGAHLSPKQKEKQRRKALRQEELDIFDVVLEFLQAEGFAETLEQAEWMMANVIDEEAIDIILGEGREGGRFEYGQRHGRPLITPEISQRASEKETLGGGTYERGSKRLPKNKRKYDRQVLSGVRAASDQEKQRARKRMSISAEAYDYVNEAQHARENPEKYEREQAKKSAPVRGERTPMPPRGDKRREDFEKWYAKQMGR